MILFCFAVEEEARPFRELSRADAGCHILVTGIGRSNAQRALNRSLQRVVPRSVISSGFAGGLNPDLSVGTVLFEADPNFYGSAFLIGAGAQPGRFHCADGIISSARGKWRLWETTEADAVEMESQAIRGLCRARGIQSATVRVISDAVNEDLPLDFNKLMTADHALNYRKLVWTLVKSPRSLPGLFRFRTRVNGAAAALAQVLRRFVQALPHAA